MKGKYKTPSGEIKEVHDFDSKNKIVSVHKGSGQYEHHAESEYKDWKPVKEDNVNTQGIEPTVFEEGDAPRMEPDTEDDERAKEYEKTHQQKPAVKAEDKPHVEVSKTKKQAKEKGTKK